METKLTWQEIEKQYNQQWVQLIDYDWPDGEPYPSGGTVQFHAATRKEFNVLSLSNPANDAARVFVGKVKAPPGVVLSSNAVKMTLCE